MLAGGKTRVGESVQVNVKVEYLMYEMLFSILILLDISILNLFL